MHDGEDVAGGLAVVPLPLGLMIRLCDGRESEKEGVVLDVGPVGLAVVELPTGTVGMEPVEKG